MPRTLRPQLEGGRIGTPYYDLFWRGWSRADTAYEESVDDVVLDVTVKAGYDFARLDVNTDGVYGTAYPTEEQLRKAAAILTAAADAIGAQR